MTEAQLHGFPYFEIQFSRDGKLVDAAEANALTTFVAGQSVTDLFVMSHGWNNDIPEARALFNRFFACVRTVLDAGRVPLPGRSFAVVCVFWPSKRFTESARIPGGAASLGAPDVTTALAAQIDDLEGVFDGPAANRTLTEAKALLPQLEYNPAARKQFADLVRSLLDPDGGERDEDASAQFFSTEGDQLMTRLSRPLLPAPGPGTGSSGGAAAFNRLAGIGQLASGIGAAAERLLNFATYWQMKNRAGTIGRGGVNELLRQIRSAQPALNVHLIGHSFGARLVTAAAFGAPGAPAMKPASLTLLQAAFSHYAFARDFQPAHDGFYRGVVADRMVSGPILATCTVNDEAVGKLYPLASLVAGQIASALGDRNDPYGGLGRNGAQKTPEASDGTLLAVGSAYEFAAGAIYNLVADGVIKDHGDIAHDEVAYALLQSVAVT